MARLTLQQVHAVAELAAIALSPEEERRLCEELGAILDHFEALQRVDVSGIEPTVHPIVLPPALREDRAQLSGLGPELLSAAPESDQGGFAVPRVLDGES